MLRNKVFILLITDDELMKGITFLINLEDHHPNSEIKIMASDKTIKFIEYFIGYIDYNLNIEFHSFKNEKSLFRKLCAKEILLNELIKEKDVIILEDISFMQSSLPLEKFTKDFGGIEKSNGKFTRGLVYFTNENLAKEYLLKKKEVFDNSVLPDFKDVAILKIQRCWCAYKKKYIDISEKLKKNLKKLKKSISTELLEYNLSDFKNKYKIDYLDYEINLCASFIENQNKLNIELVKEEKGYIRYDDKLCSLLSLKKYFVPGSNQEKIFQIIYKKILDSRNNIRNCFLLWDNNFKLFKFSFSGNISNFSVNNNYLINTILGSNTAFCSVEDKKDEIYIKLGIDPVYIYNYPTSKQFTPLLLGCYYLILAYPMKEEDKIILDDRGIAHINLNMNLPQMFEYVEKVQKLNLKKEKRLYSLKCHKTFGCDEEGRKEYEEYLKEISRSKYMIVFNDEKLNKCTQITEALALGTIPILVKENNIIINNENFKEDIHYLVCDNSDVKNKINSITDEKYNMLKENCKNFYDKYESTLVFNRKMIRFAYSRFENYLKFIDN